MMRSDLTLDSLSMVGNGIAIFGLLLVMYTLFDVGSSAVMHRVGFNEPSGFLSPERVQRRVEILKAWFAIPLLSYLASIAANLGTSELLGGRAATVLPFDGLNWFMVGAYILFLPAIVYSIAPERDAWHYVRSYEGLLSHVSRPGAVKEAGIVEKTAETLERIAADSDSEDGKARYANSLFPVPDQYLACAPRWGIGRYLGATGEPGATPVLRFLRTRPVLVSFLVVDLAATLAFVCFVIIDGGLHLRQLGGAALYLALPGTAVVATLLSTRSSLIWWSRLWTSEQLFRSRVEDWVARERADEGDPSSSRNGPRRTASIHLPFMQLQIVVSASRRTG